MWVNSPGDPGSDFPLKKFWEKLTFSALAYQCLVFTLQAERLFIQKKVEILNHFLNSKYFPRLISIYIVVYPSQMFRILISPKKNLFQKCSPSRKCYLSKSPNVSQRFMAAQSSDLTHLFWLKYVQLWHGNKDGKSKYT